MASLNDMPLEIIDNIFNKVCLNNTPLFNYRLRFVNKDFNKLSINYNGKICKDIDDTDEDKFVLFKKGNVEMYKWLFMHEININYIDTLSLILCNRLEILNLMMNYSKYEVVLFNRYYFCNYDIIDYINIYHFGKTYKSYLFLACECGNLNIVKFFVNDNKLLYYNQIEQALEICKVKRNFTIYNYLVLWQRYFSQVTN